MKNFIVLSLSTFFSFNCFASLNISCPEIEAIFKTDSYITRYESIKSLKIDPLINDWADEEFKQMKVLTQNCKKEGFLKRYGDSTFSQYITDAMDEIKKYKEQDVSSNKEESTYLEALNKIEKRVDELKDKDLTTLKKNIEQIETELNGIGAKSLPTSKTSKIEESIHGKIEQLKDKLLDDDIMAQQTAMAKETQALIEKFKAESIEQANKNRKDNPKDYKRCMDLEIKLSPMDKKRKELLEQFTKANSLKMKTKLSKDYEDISYKSDIIRPEYNKLECPKYFHD